MRLISDRALRAVTVWQEAEGEPYVGKVAVAETELRREQTGYNSDSTAAGTVARRYQFSSWNDDPQDNARLIKSLQIDDDDPVVRECARAVDEAAAGSNLVPDAVLYYRDGSPKPAWADKCVLVAKVGNHLFFKEE